MTTAVPDDRREHRGGRLDARPGSEAAPGLVTVAATYAGLRVLDLSTNIAGPFASMILGDLGADVVKIERLPNGDDTRSLPPRWGDEATVFLAMNRNKRSVALDIKSVQGRDAVLKLAEAADVVIESFAPGLGQKLGLMFEDFRARNPAILVCSVSAFGDGEIGARLPGYDALVQAASGLMSFTGHPDTAPVRIAPSVLDLSTGLWAAIGLMAALARREKGGGAEHVRASLIDSAFALMSHQLLGYLATGELPQKLGSGAPSATPYGVFAALDGQIMIATATDSQFVRLCGVLGLEQAAVDERFRTMAERIRHRDALTALIGGKIAPASVAHWLDVLAGAGISVARVNDLQEALDMPVSRERNLFIEPSAIGWSKGMKLLRLPIDPSGSAVRLPPPSLGEHSVQILRDAGFSDEAIKVLIAPREPAAERPSSADCTDPVHSTS
jgi:crotonobetainyl-CoA:carnitine CoA-transferase CaiB-like acyl-CoA transferase